MELTDLEKAREWAESVGKIEGLMPGPRAAVEVIQSLPDQWVDAEKVQELADQLVEEAGDFASEGLADRYMTIAKRLRDILLAMPRPEDVPAGEPWIVEHYDHEWVGARDDSGTTNYPWALAKIDGTDYVLSQDVEVTLVSRLVPERKENA